MKSSWTAATSPPARSTAPSATPSRPGLVASVSCTRARHNLGVALPEGVELTIDGSAGYYAAGLNNGAAILVRGGVGWGAAESMRDGTVVIDGDAGNAVAASIRAGTVVVRGSAWTRAGIAMKGGLLIVAGDVGPMAGFMMQKGDMIVCGDAADGVADSMYAGTVYIGAGTASWEPTPCSRTWARPTSSGSPRASSDGRSPRARPDSARWSPARGSGTSREATGNYGNPRYNQMNPNRTEFVTCLRLIDIGWAAVNWTARGRPPVPGPATPPLPIPTFHRILRVRDGRCPVCRDGMVGGRSRSGAAHHDGRRMQAGRISMTYVRKRFRD